MNGVPPAVPGKARAPVPGAPPKPGTRLLVAAGILALVLVLAGGVLAW